MSGRIDRQTLKKLRPRSAVFQFNRLLGRYSRAIWVLGEGRSGTTLLADLISAFGSYRTMFEPFHPGRVSESGFLPMLTYRRPSEDDPQLQAFASRVFSGALVHPWVDRRSNGGFIHDGLIVKDVFASLIAKWALQRFPTTKPVLILRNPFAVAQSKRRTGNWAWVKRPAELLAQRALVDDHLNSRQVAVLEDADRSGDLILAQIAIWAAVHFVMFRQFSPGELHLVFYENLVSAPGVEMDRLAGFLARPAPGAARIEKVMATPTSVATVGSVERARDTTNAWRRDLSETEISRGLAVLSAFDLVNLYDREGQPVGSALNHFA